MSSTQNFQKYIHEKLGFDEKITFRKMFGNYCLYSSGIPVALVCDNQLFVKPTKNAEEYLQKFGTVEKGHPFPGAKLWILFENLENEKVLQDVLAITENEYM
jgi:hypothetical protein